MSSHRSALLATLLAVLTLVPACSSMYYGMMENFGVEKREILADRVVEGRDEQEEAKEQFVSALEAFKAVASFDGGELEAVYEQLNTEYERCVDKADDVTGRIQSIESVAEALFEEWEEDNALISDPDLRRGDAKRRDDTMDRYDQLIAAMKKAESKMQPVLVKFRDQVLYLKGALNAQAIASLQDDALEIQSDVDALIAEMETSINEANAFIETLG